MPLPGTQPRQKDCGASTLSTTELAGTSELMVYISTALPSSAWAQRDGSIYKTSWKLRFTFHCPEKGFTNTLLGNNYKISWAE